MFKPYDLLRPLSGRGIAINLKELSTRLGLSPTTVSRALSGYSDVSPATRERVQQVARELGYQPNRAARQIALGRSDAIGIVYSLGTEFLGNPAFLEMLGGMAQRLEQSGFDLLLAAAPQHDEMRIYERMVRGRRVDALVVAHTLVDDPRIEYLLGSGMPFLAYGRSRRPERYPWFDFDNEACSRLAVERLVALGHRRIGYVHSPLAYNFAFQRHAGYLQAMRAAGIEPAPAWIVQGGLERRAGYAALRRLLEASPPPTAAIVDNNSGGVGVLRALIDAGIAIGRGFSVIVNEGVPADTTFQGLQVAAIAQPTEHESGRTMGEMVLALAERRPLATPHVLRQPAYVDGNTVAPPPP